MPYRRRKKTTGSTIRKKKPFRRTYRKRKQAPRNTMTSHVARPIFQEKRNLVLEYNASGYITQAALTNSNTAFFRLNSVYDPDYSNVTRNAVASGYGTLSGIYQKILIRGASIQFKVANTSSFPMSISMTPTYDVSGSSWSTTNYVGQYASRNGAKSTAVTAVSGSRSMATLSGYYKCNQVVGQPYNVYAASATAAFNVNPSPACYCALSIGTMYDSAQNTGSAYFTVRIRYYATVMDVYDNIWNA